MSKGNLFIVTGPSGAGKGTVLSRLLPAMERLHCSVSATTRQPRPGEQDGVNYYFLAKPAFEEMIRRNEFLEYAEYVGNYYGTPAAPVDECLEKGIDVILDFVVLGALFVNETRPEARLVFIIPPSFADLELRLRSRGSESAEAIQKRLAKAREEYASADQYDYIVVNDQVEGAAEELRSIIQAARCAADRRINLLR